VKLLVPDKMIVFDLPVLRGRAAKYDVSKFELDQCDIPMAFTETACTPLLLCGHEIRSKEHYY
jgi:hypothetical protein